MRKKNKTLFLLSGFIFAFSFLFLTTKVEAKMVNLFSDSTMPSFCNIANKVPDKEDDSFWNVTCGKYKVEEPQTNKFLHFNHINQNNTSMNYTFDYAYKISLLEEDNVTPRLWAGYANEFYAITEPTKITYTNLQYEGGNNPIDKFIVYKYNYLNGYFDPITNFKENTSGTYEISTSGIYKVQTQLLQNGIPLKEGVTYLFYEHKYQSSILNSIDYNTSNKNLEFTITAKSPKLLDDVKLKSIDFAIKDNARSITNVSMKDLHVQIDKIDNENDIYQIVLTGIAPVDSLLNDTVIIYLESVNMYTAIISGDFKDPVVNGEIKYYPKGYIYEDLSINTNSKNVRVGSNSIAILNVSDETEVIVTLNGKVCDKIDDNGTYSCDIIFNKEINYLEYVVTDKYDNKVEYLADSYKITPIAMDPEDANLAIKFNESSVVFSKDGKYKTVETMCVFYSKDSDQHICSSSSEDIILPIKQYFKGNLDIVVKDIYGNIIRLEKENVLFNNGYNSQDFIFIDVSGDDTYQKPIGEDVKKLLMIACGSDDLVTANQNCKNSIKFKIKLDEKEIALNINTNEELINYKLPTYLDLLNNYFKEGSSCGFSKCDKTLEFILEYNIGDTIQRISSYYKFLDNLPYITDMDLDNKIKDFDFKDIENKRNDREFQKSLFAPIKGDYQKVIMSDGSNSIVIPRYIKYIDRKGNVTDYNGSYKEWDYIIGRKDFGIYILECLVITKFDAQGDPIEDKPVKNFYIRVNLADLKKPNLALLGSEEITLKQYDTYKNPGQTCKDDSGCKVIFEYYLNDENNKVDSVDTKIPGKYIIKYIATDGDGNQETKTRIVNVVSVNTMDVTSIIIISVVILVFIGFVTLGIVIQVKKKKKEGIVNDGK